MDGIEDIGRDHIEVTNSAKMLGETGRKSVESKSGSKVFVLRVAVVKSLAYSSIGLTNLRD